MPMQQYNKYLFFKMASRISDLILAAIGTAGSLVASVFLSPPKFVWGISGLIIAAAGFGLILRNRWVQSLPNQWLLVIRNGQMIHAGVGLKTFIGISDSVVRFPSKVEKVQFKANNVTKQMQGVIITGFAFWSVFRDEDGPFRCYKYMEGGDANSNVQAMCESVLRNLIANSSLDEVLKNRNHLRDNMMKDLKDQFKGWGVWLETVEITEVTISSSKLFTDLQAQFRQDTRLKAEKIQLTTKEQITKQRQESDMKINEYEQLNNTKKEQTRNNEQLKRANQQAVYDLKKNELQLQRLEREKELSIQRLEREKTITLQSLKNELEKEEKRIENDQKIAKAKRDYDIECQKLAIEMDKIRLEFDRLHDDKTMQAKQIDTMERIYNKLSIKQLKINQFTGQNDTTNLASIIPSLGFAMNQLKTVE